MPQTFIMKKFFAQDAIEKMDNRVFFFLVFAYQLLLIFQGFDLSDEGLFSTFYQEVFKNPQTVQFSFMFWFSGMLGGIWVYLFPWTGVLGIRLAGVIVLTLAIMVSYRMLKKYLNPAYLKLGLLLAMMVMNYNPKSLYYNNLSSLIYVLTALCLFTGLKEKKPGRLFVGGLLVALNMFTRLPNILGLGLVVIILYYGLINKTSFRDQFRQAIIFISGFCFTTILVLGIMKWIGHLDLFINSVKLVSEMGRAKAESSYGIMKLINRNLSAYKRSFTLWVYISFFVLVVLMVVHYIRNTIRMPWISRLIKYASLLAFALVIAKGIITSVDLLYIIVGFTLAVGVLVVIFEKNNDIKVLMVIGCFILIVHPLGSSEGIDTVAEYSLWIAFPIAVNFIFNIRTIEVQNSFTFFKGLPESSGIFYVGETTFNEIRKYALYCFVFGCLFYVYFYPLFDRSNRLKMHYAIHNKYLHGIFTGKNRADAMNDLLSESAKYVKANDYLLVYDNTPMINYLTETKPYIRNPWPWLYESPVFKTELYRSLDETKQLPVVIEQKIKTIGSGGAWPDKLAQDTVEWSRMNQVRNEILDAFLSNNHYTTAWESNYFRILVPGKMP